MVACIFFTEVHEHVPHLCPSPRPRMMSCWSVIFCSHLRLILVIIDVTQWTEFIHHIYDQPYCLVTGRLGIYAYGECWWTQEPPISVALLCGVQPIIIYTDTVDNFCTKMSGVPFLNLLPFLAKESDPVHGSVKCLFGMPPKGQHPLPPLFCLLQVSLQTWNIRSPFWWSLRWLPLHVTTKATSWYRE